jgi:hypothetical protein
MGCPKPWPSKEAHDRHTTSTADALKNVALHCDNVSHVQCIVSVQQCPMMRKSLYVIMFGEQEFFKIGVSSNPMKRLATLQGACPKQLSIAINLDLPRFHAHGVEQAMHRRLKKYRVSGEWFAVSLEQLAKDLEDVMRIYETSELRKRQEAKLRRVQDGVCANPRLATVLQPRMSQRLSWQEADTQDS